MEKVTTGQSPESVLNQEVAKYVEEELRMIMNHPQPSLENFARAMLRVTNLTGSQRSYTGPQLAAAIFSAHLMVIQKHMSGRPVSPEDIQEVFGWIPRVAGLRDACVQIMEKELALGSTPRWEVFGKLMTATNLDELIQSVPENTTSFDGGQTFVDVASVRRELETLKKQLNNYFLNPDTGQSEVMDQTAVADLLEQCLSRLPKEGEFSVALQHTVRRIVLPEANH